jgi:hypothetical protein
MNPTFYLALFIIAVLLFVIVISWIGSYKKKERKKKLFKEFDDFVIANKLTIDKRQTLNRNIIGLDRLNMKLVFIENTNNHQQTYLIDLEELSECRLTKQKNERKGYINKISLQCIFKQENKPDVILPVYDDHFDNHYKMMRLSKKASYWQKTITIFKEPEITATS